MTVPQPHGTDCPNCGAPVRFRWAQAVQATCAYCRSVLVRRDLDLATLGQQADFPATRSPIQLGTEGQWHNMRFVVVGRITYGWHRGRWNEWHCVLNDGQSAWLSDAQLEYAMTIIAPADTVVPDPATVQVGETYVWNDTPYDVVGITEAQYLGTEGELPFTTWDKRRCLFVDLQNAHHGFATIDGTDVPPLLFLGEYVTFDDLRFRNLREFEGW
ncbi:MAG: DUF4178 domain-containing protein [Gemmatimonadota bacterium]|nr:DUF4178 domain-containing protein [Gemmatimonadota bacterium]